MTRSATIERITKETQVRLTLNLDGSGQATVSTGVGFFDHMLDHLARHGQFDLSVQCAGDLHIDEHHTVEDVAICLGQAIDRALGERAGIVRTAHAFVPMDEALCFAAIDISGRPYAVVDAEFGSDRIGGLATDLIWHIFESIAVHARLTAHLRVHYGRNDHHKCEGLFKAFARALDAATRIDERLKGAIPSTKGVL
ncbi:imidazoleglycerol-phosphate dehydratase HisB [Kallotenue papyrolyticum]|uniref:imidazoleglycerol-phosphate dehydratase HisB n=1 Tax=Kallotenue papyrolyticum TaxID=1325125 RepID=UPI0004785853|nr:imidazoleglycerol-phosphate dehydratase HisB [Kallotenue papyrolyticum]